MPLRYGPSLAVGDSQDAPSCTHSTWFVVIAVLSSQHGDGSEVGRRRSRTVTAEFGASDGGYRIENVFAYLIAPA